MKGVILINKARIVKCPNCGKQINLNVGDFLDDALFVVHAHFRKGKPNTLNYPFYCIHCNTNLIATLDPVKIELLTDEEANELKKQGA
jgi:transcription elongation factor Elf1